MQNKQENVWIFVPKFASAGVPTDNPTMKIEEYVNGETYCCLSNVLSYTLQFLKIKKLVQYFTLILEIFVSGGGGGIPSDWK